MLKRVWVPSEEELYHRQVIRRRRQLVRDRVRTQSRIKAELSFFGIRLEEPRGRWTLIYFETLQSIRFGDRWMQESAWGQLLLETIHEGRHRFTPTCVGTARRALLI